MSKIVADNIKNTEALIRETTTLINAVTYARYMLCPFDADRKEEYKTLPAYITSARKVLSQLPLADFDINYPTLESIVQNGNAIEDARARLHDAVYRLGELNKELRAKKFLVKLDTDRAALEELARVAAADLSIFLLTQFSYPKYPDEVMLGVTQYCDSKGVTPDVFFGGLLAVLEEYNEKPYGYEALSPYRDRLIEVDPAFVAECEEHSFPLTEEMAIKIINGDMQISEARGELADHLRQSTEVEVEGVTPLNMISRMELS